MNTEDRINWKGGLMGGAAAFTASMIHAVIDVMWPDGASLPAFIAWAPLETLMLFVAVAVLLRSSRKRHADGSFVWTDQQRSLLRVIFWVAEAIGLYVAARVFWLLIH